MILTILVAIIIGLSLGVYAAYIVKLVNSFKGTPRVDLVRFFALISISLLGPGGLYLVNLTANKGADEGLHFMIILSFGASIFIPFFYLLFHFSKR